MKSVKTTTVLICLIFLAIASITGIAQAPEWIPKIKMVCLRRGES